MAGHRREHELQSGSYDPLPVRTAVCEQDRLLHVCSTLHFVTLVYSFSLTR